MQEFTEKDCMQTEKEASIQNRVVVLPSKVLPEHYTGQLFFCTNIQKTENPRHSIAHLDIPQNILDTVFCRMDAMRQGYGWQIQRKYGAM